MREPGTPHPPHPQTASKLWGLALVGVVALVGVSACRANTGGLNTGPVGPAPTRADGGFSQNDAAADPEDPPSRGDAREAASAPRPGSDAAPGGIEAGTPTPPPRPPALDASPAPVPPDVMPPPPPPPVTPPPTTMPPPVMPPPMTTPPPPVAKVIIRAKEVICDLLRAKLIHAKDITADEASIGQLIESEDKRWEMERGEGKVELSELVADEVYAKDVRCRRIEAAVVHAQKARLDGKGDKD
ncbi:MAG TPA: hypothetical protein VGG33_16120 [Polyangia bacterium]